MAKEYKDSVDDLIRLKKGAMSNRQDELDDVIYKIKKSTQKKEKLESSLDDDSEALATLEDIRATIIDCKKNEERLANEIFKMATTNNSTVKELSDDEISKMVDNPDYKISTLKIERYSETEMENLKEQRNTYKETRLSERARANRIYYGREK